MFSRGIFAVLLPLLCLLEITTGSPADGSSQQRRGSQKLSDHEHHTEEEGHNMRYDHDAFLGKEQAQTFSDLTPEEAKRRLIIIIDKIDTNKDGSVSEEELTKWIRGVSRRYAFDDRDRHWDYHVTDGRKYLSLEDYLKKSFGMIEDRQQLHDQNRNLTYNEVIVRYERRFQTADRDKNQLLDKDEFADFLHPHDVPDMKHIVVEETFMDMDKNRDGEVTLEEYLYDLHFSYPDDDNSWREVETKHFHSQRDKNGDGVLTNEEIDLWLFPPNNDPCVNEAKHLIHHADVNKDKILSKDEIVDHQDLFVGSQATEHGQIFVRHDEF